MKCASFILILAAIIVSADDIMLEEPLLIPRTDDQLSYDDGTAMWLTWEGLYRGVWFNVTDFGLSPGTGWTTGDSEYWFFHTSSYQWDTSSFYADLYNGDSSGPAVMLDQTSVTAAHFAPVYASFPSPIACGDEFWVLVNTEMSEAGWPSSLGDNSANPVNHSFLSDDFIHWEPWLTSHTTANDYLIRSCYGGTSVESDTWASIKALYNP